MKSKSKQKRYKYKIANLLIRLYNSSLRDIIIFIAVLGGVAGFVYFKMLRPQ